MPKFGETIIVSNDYVHIGERSAKLIMLGLEKIMIQAKQEAKDLVRIDTTTLQKSIAYRKISDGIYELYTNVNYAVYQEYGYHHYGSGHWVYPQPFMMPAAINASGKIEAMIGAVMAQR